MQLSMNGVAVVVPDDQLETIVRDRILSVVRPSQPKLYVVPKIGEYWHGQGGIYAGTRRGKDGAPDYHLIFANEKTKGNHAHCLKWATDLEIDGHKDFDLPDRGDGSVLFGNAGEHFEKEWHWLKEQCASASDYAWLQDFDLGHQVSSHKGNEFLARAVRRLVIEN